MTPDLADRVRGVLFGQAVGDALGFGTEFLPKSAVARFYPDGLSDYAQIGGRFAACEQWRPGDWTDDTDQLLCVLDSLLELGALVPLDVAARLRHWGLSDGYGMGQTVYFCVHHPRFAERPFEVAQEYWESRGRRAAANGAVMRTSVLGVWRHRQRDEVVANAASVCRLTHADPRCVGSCVAVCLAVRALIEGAEVSALIDEAAAAALPYHPEMKDAFALADQPSLEALDLDEGMNEGEQNRHGYTLEALAAAFWALRHAADFERGIGAIIHEAGDADTNAAVAGSLLGARFGLSGIPRRWVEGLVHREALERRAERLLGALGVTE
jgi:ADP-ribosylglycohydrolase